jgi:hypothetical protein
MTQRAERIAKTEVDEDIASGIGAAGGMVPQFLEREHAKSTEAAGADVQGTGGEDKVDEGRIRAELNRDAIDDYNRFIEQHEPWSESSDPAGWWAKENRDFLECYGRYIEQRGSFSKRMRRYR